MQTVIALGETVWAFSMYSVCKSKCHQIKDEKNLRNYKTVLRGTVL